MSLSQLRVLELGSSLAVAYCGQQFARWGAQVFADNSAHTKLAPCISDESVGGAYLQANKLLTSDTDALLAEADVVLTDQPPKQPVNGILHIITTFPGGMAEEQAGASSLQAEALSGFMSVNGDAEREPARMPGNMTAYITGVSAFIATLAALRKRSVSGSIETIRTNELDTLTTITPFVRAQHLEAADRREGGPQTGVRLFPVGGGAISANLYGKRTFAKVLATLGLTMEDVPAHLQEPKQRYDTQAFHAFLRTATAGRRAEEVFDGMMSQGEAPMGLYHDTQGVLNDRHLAETHYFGTLNHPTLGPMRYPGPPARFSRHNAQPPAPPESRSAWSGEPLSFPANATSNAKPLAGIRVIDFTQAWIGPYATMLLADLGAEVIKIESHKRADVWRIWPEKVPVPRVQNANAHPLNTCPNFNTANRNKREIAIDLSQPEGQALARTLIRDADIVIDNYTPKIMTRFGLDYDALRAINPDIIAIAWSGYGKTGPYADYKANGTTIEAISGWDSLFGYEDGEPMVLGNYQADAITGLQLAACTLLALFHRELTGEGQLVSGSMIEAAIGYIGEELLYASKGKTSQRFGNRHPHFLQGVFACRDDASASTRYVALTCQTETQRQALQDLCDVRSGELEQQHIAEWCARQTLDDALTAFRQHGIPAAPILDSLEILEHPAFEDRHWFQPQTHADVGEMLYPGFPWTFAQCELTADLPPPRLGEHTREILSEHGFDDEEIESLFGRDVIGCVLSA